MSERKEAAAAAEEQEAPASGAPAGEAEPDVADTPPAAEPEPDAGDTAPAADAEPAPGEPEPERAAEEELEPEPAAEEPEPEPAAEEELEPEPAVPVAVGPAAGRQAKVYLCDRGHRTVAVWNTPTACHARPLRSGAECGRPLYSISALPEQVQRALNPLKASKKTSKG